MIQFIFSLSSPYSWNSSYFTVSFLLKQYITDCVMHHLISNWNILRCTLPFLCLILQSDIHRSPTSRFTSTHGLLTSINLRNLLCLCIGRILWFPWSWLKIVGDARQMKVEKRYFYIFHWSFPSLSRNWYCSGNAGSPWWYCMDSKLGERNHRCYLEWEWCHYCRPEIDRWPQSKWSGKILHSFNPGFSGQFFLWLPFNPCKCICCSSRTTNSSSSSSSSYIAVLRCGEIDQRGDKEWHQERKEAALGATRHGFGQPKILEWWCINQAFLASE